MSDSAAPSASLVGQLVDYCFGLEPGNLPAAAVDQAALLFLDLLGAALAGGDTPEALAARRAVTLMSPGGGSCCLWGTSETAGAAGAVLYNGIIAHARELDDFGGVDHTGAVVVPAIVAVAESGLPLSGERALAAMITGYEVGRRVLDCAGGYRPHNHGDGFHSTGTCGSFAAAAAAARAMDLTREQTVWALGLAGSFAGGTWAFNEDGAMSKRFNVGRAAETGFVAATLARSGFTGPSRIIEAKWGGFLNTYVRTAPQQEALLAEHRPGYGILRSGIKPYAACRDIHSSIDVILDLRQRHNLVAEEVVSIEVRCIPEMIQMVGRTHFPTSRIEAQLSLPYSIAVAMVTGQAFIDEFDVPWLDEPQVRRLAAKIRLIESRELPFDSEPYLTLKTADGLEFAGHVDYAGGAPENPLPPGRVVAKFEALAGRVLCADLVAELRDLVLALPDIADIREISRCLRL
jgi:2-methylcitrate dehydratase PrpD